ncbi:MAG TPA: SLBB domain-containing protein [Terracidiphilus sp.]
MQNCLPELSIHFKPSRLKHLLVGAIVCALAARCTIAQAGSDPSDRQTQYSDQQMQSFDQQNQDTGTSRACYLGGFGPVPGSAVRSQGMALPQSTLSQMQASDGQYAQQGSAYSTDQTDADQPPGQSQVAMSADEMIAILQQVPELLIAVKTALAQGFAVDPSIISDDGAYNCIRQDANFRNGVASELREQGYSANPQETNPRNFLGAETQGAAPGRTQPRSQGENSNFPRRTSNFPSRPVNVPEEQPSEMLQRTPIPYRNLPSLIELYSQVVPANGKLRRFGSETFLFGTGNVNELPMDLPAGPDYVLGPGDNVAVNMWGVLSSRLERPIDRQGQIALPEAGTVTVTGLTMSQAQSAIQTALGTQFQNEHVELSLGRVRTVRVYVVGDVQRPGAYDVSSLSTALNALYAAGGPTGRGSLRTLKHYRGQQLIREIDLYDLLLHGVRSDLERLLPGDTILVPPIAAQVTVAGMVRRPAIYELKDEQNLSEVLALAGGLLVSASLEEIRVERVEPHDQRTTLSVRVPDGTDGSTAAMPAFHVQDGDNVTVAPILPYNNQVVYLDGHVFKPGPHAWHEGMTVNDLLHSYKDVMPEPSSYAEVIRLQPPDLRPETISFDLSQLLIGNDPIALQPFDVVRVFGRYEIDPPKVSIHGEVERPGEYPMSEGMTVAGLVRMAGGFKRSAYRKQADLSSYVIQNDEKVLVKHSVVEISKALDGDKSADAVLEPGDVVGIRQLTGWQDIGASVTIDGEVRFPGTYGIEEDEHLSSVLERAGGLRDDAYPSGAVLERVAVRQMEENSWQEMIRRIESTMSTVTPGLSSPQDQQNLLQTMQQQQQQVLASLRDHTSTGRLVIKISPEFSQWEKTPADVVMRAGDRLTIPKRPDFVLVGGQVYNATGITYRPRKDARWYLRQAGGVTRSGEKRSIFIVRADGSVVGEQGSVLFGNSVLDLRLQPGDSIVVPEKVMGGFANLAQPDQHRPDHVLGGPERRCRGSLLGNFELSACEKRRSLHGLFRGRPKHERD